MHNEVENNIKQEESEEMIRCPKCGAPMKKSWRCCMHCGELNFLNKDNNSMKPFVILGKKLKKKEEEKEAKRKDIRLTKLDDNGISKQEKNYTTVNKVLTLLFVVIIIVLIINYKSVMNIFDNFRKTMYVNQITKIVEKLDDDPSIAGCLTKTNDGKKYFIFYSSADYVSTLFSFYTFDYFQGAIQIIDNPDGSHNYVVSVSDGKYGFKDIIYDKDKMKSALKELEEVPYPEGESVCE